MYAAVADPACYPGTTVLKNLRGLTSQAELDRFEVAAAGRRFIEPMPGGRFSVRHFKAVHHHIFQDVHAWAGRPRTIRITKGESTFCYPEHIETELRRIFAGLKAAGLLRGLGRKTFATGAAHFAAELNAIHAFRDGNGRAQLAFMAILAAHAGHPLDLEQLDPKVFLAAMIKSFHGSEGDLANQFLQLTTP